MVYLFASVLTHVFSFAYVTLTIEVSGQNSTCGPTDGCGQAQYDYIA